MHLIRAAWTGSPVSAPPTHRAVGLMEASSFRSRRAVKGRSPPAAARETRALDSPSASEVLVSMRSTALAAEFTSRRWAGASARGRSAARSIVAGGTGRFAFGLRLAEPWQLGERESLARIAGEGGAKRRGRMLCIRLGMRAFRAAALRPALTPTLSRLAGEGDFEPPPRPRNLTSVHAISLLAELALLAARSQLN